LVLLGTTLFRGNLSNASAWNLKLISDQREIKDKEDSNIYLGISITVGIVFGLFYPFMQWVG
jgi:hypothetical protein